MATVKGRVGSIELLTTADGAVIRAVPVNNLNAEQLRDLGDLIFSARMQLHDNAREAKRLKDQTK